MHMSKQKQQKNTSINITVKFKTDLMLQFMPYSNKTICHYQFGEAIIKNKLIQCLKHKTLHQFLSVLWPVNVTGLEKANALRSHTHTHTHTHTYIHMHAHTYTHTHMHTHIHAHMHIDTTHTHACAHTHTHEHTHILTHIHTHTHTHTHKHTHTQPNADRKPMLTASQVRLKKKETISIVLNET